MIDCALKGMQHFLLINAKHVALSRPIGSLLAATHHCRNLSSSLVVDAGQHQRGQEEEEGADGRVHQVLQPETQTHGESGRVSR